MNTTPPHPASSESLTEEQRASIAASGARFREKLRQSAEGRIQIANHDGQRTLRKKLLTSPETLEEFMNDAAVRMSRC